MKKVKSKPQNETTDERDTMRPEYDFSGAVRGVTAARYAKGTNIVVAGMAGRERYFQFNEQQPLGLAP